MTIVFRIIEKVNRRIANYRFKQYKFKSKGDNCYAGSRVSVRSPECMIIGDNVYIEDNCKIQAWPEYRGELSGTTPELVIGGNVSFMENCHISCMNSVVIGEGCLFGDNVFITDNFHGKVSVEEMSVPPIERRLFTKGGVVIGKNVWVGRNVCIMPNVVIGDGAIVAANAVVTRDVLANTVVAGVPAKVVKQMN